MRIAAVAAVFVMILAPFPAAAQAPEGTRNQIIVRGWGQVEVPPTQAVVTVGAQHQRPEAADAGAEVSRIADRILARLLTLGIRRQEIRTSGVQLVPIYSAPRDGTPQVVGYRATYLLTLTLTDLRLVGQVLDESVKAGANQILGVTFGLRDPSEARREALTLAVREARDKAEAIARAAGLQIKGIAQISEESVDVEVRAFSRAAPAPQPVPMPIEPGLITVTARVTMVFVY
ncbi:MAG: SIMPL domain-containing protein [Armatimonadota bacterium]|nr:SIMPL domain-containing protein [Armatimonadota bacterium]MDR7450844.1 SIMPL domain-containing protein [Armatimonadota bacterium]MDR7465765.1 SIMPL domain-containing protein [Armatimonadota bacterium]MDR7493673.1 SIMPL domain-containing protein [Armatimonadota bacterium]MDR7499078.1 SIMPL domain-containing protein [Armatimonadota bacterium]